MSETATQPEIEPTAESVPARNAVPRVLEAIQNEPWAITQDSMRTICAIASRENDVSIEALEAVQTRRVQNTFGLRVRDGVAVLNVVGPVMRYADIFAMVSGATSYEALRKDLEVAVRDPQVRAILFNFDSPGGMVNGCAEMANAIRAAGAVKPVEAYVGGSACSAAYWMATACNRITIDATAHVGSIGVLFTVRDSSERDARAGVKTFEMVSSRAPNKRMSYDTDDGKAKLQKWADSLEAVFIEAVASNRGVTDEEVAVNFGAGGIEVGADAVRIGMADATGSFEEVFGRLKSGSGQKGRKKEAPIMTDKTYTQAELDAAVANAKRDGATEANASAQAATATAEANAQKLATERVKAITTAPEAEKRQGMAKHLAFNTSMSANEAIDLLKVSAEERQPEPEPQNKNAGKPQNNGERARDAVGGLALDAIDKNGGKGDEDDKPKKPAIDTSAIYERRAKQHQTS